MKKTSLAILLAVVCTFVTASGQLFLKLGADKLNPLDIVSLLNITLIVGCVLYFVGAIIMIFAFKHGELSVVYPILSISFIWVALLSLVFLKETLTLSQGIGIFIIILGVSLVGKGGIK